MTKKEAIRRSVKHWQQLVRWAEEGVKSGKTMADYCSLVRRPSIFDGACPLCQWTMLKNNGRRVCLSCPLAQAGYGCVDRHFSLWRNVYNAEILEDFRYHADLLLRVLNTL